MYDPKYYADRKEKLMQKSNSLVQRFLNTTFDFVNDANDNAVLIRELQEKELESQSKKEPKQEVAGQPLAQTNEDVSPDQPVKFEKPEQKTDKPKN